MTEKTDNMKIWDQVCTTDPEFTKEATGKGFACTSINPQYVWEKLTRVFGPCGIGWGYTVLKEEYRNGHTDGENTTVLHVIKVGLWYVGKRMTLLDEEPQEWRSDNIEAFGQTYFVRKTSGGWKTDEEAPKKSLTDALTKAASMIGVSADIFSGKWDGHKDQGRDNGKQATTPTAKTYNPEGFTETCPKCGKVAIIPSKFKDAAYVCYKKKGGCGAKFASESELHDDIPLDPPSVRHSYISEADRSKIFAKARSAEWTDEEVKDLLEGSFGIQSTKEIPVDKLDEILSYID